MEYETNQKKKGKKILIVIIVLLLAAAAAAAVLWFLHKRKAADNGEVYIDTVAAIMGEEGDSQNNRFAGVTESKKSWEVKLDEGSSVGKIYVKVGDAVKKGDKLFSYDTDRMGDNRTQAEIDLQRLKNERSAMTSTINQLKQEKQRASAADQGGYTIQIQEQELAAKQKDIEIQEKTKELNKIQDAVKDATVTSEIDGVVKSINRSQAGDIDDSEDSEDMEDDYGFDEGGSDSTAFMTIMQTSDLQIRATANEQNIASVEEGAAVIVHSRVDDTVWKGTITKVDSETPQTNSSDEDMMMGEDEGDGETDETSSSSYPFYIELESAEGLLLGQHVYVTMDTGSGSKDGIWLDEMFIVDVDSDPYVLAENSKGQLKKRPVTIGEYDEELMQYEITGGLTKKDRIAMPEEAEE